jgi:hypothetical protein
MRQDREVRIPMQFSVDSAVAESPRVFPRSILGGFTPRLPVVRAVNNSTSAVLYTIMRKLGQAKRVVSSSSISRYTDFVFL